MLEWGERVKDRVSRVIVLLPAYSMAGRSCQWPATRQTWKSGLKFCQPRPDNLAHGGGWGETTANGSRQATTWNRNHQARAAATYGTEIRVEAVVLDVWGVQPCCAGKKSDERLEGWCISVLAVEMVQQFDRRAPRKCGSVTGGTAAVGRGAEGPRRKRVGDAHAVVEGVVHGSLGSHGKCYM